MTQELIWGKSGSPHIDGNDIGTINLAMRGIGNYVLDYKGKLKATVASANKITIGTGVMSFEGRDIIISAAETVTIESGSQGMKRNDIICEHYHRDTSTGVETTNLVAIKGTPASSNPKDPTIPSGTILGGATDAYMPLYRVPLDGITVGTPVQLFEILTPLKTVGDSVTQSGWQSLEMLSGFTAAQGWGVRGLMIKRVGSLVSLYGMVRRTGGWEDGYQVARIPEEMRPSYRVCAPTLYINEGLSSIGEQSDNPDMSILRLGYTHYGDGYQATLISMMWML